MKKNVKNATGAKISNTSAQSVLNVPFEETNTTIENVISEETKKSENGKGTSQNVNLDENEETLQKSLLFAEISKSFGFLSVKLDDIADRLHEENKDLKFSQIKKLASEEIAKNKKHNEKINNLSYEAICEHIAENGFISDLQPYLFTDDLLSLKSRIVTSDNKVILYHGKQSEISEKFETLKVSVKGKQLTYEDVTFVSYIDYSVQNVLRALRNYSYFANSNRRCNRLLLKETDKVKETTYLLSVLHYEYKYTYEDLKEVCENALDAMF